MAEAAVELVDLTAGYGDTVVLDGLDLVVKSGESLSILGRNGVGKSSLLATLMGHTDVHQGAIRLFGSELGKLSAYRRVHAGLGFVPQEREVFASLSVMENLLVARRPGDWDVDKVFEMFPRLAERRRNRGSQLSGGEQQMLAIGRALMGNPKVLLMDEPSEGLAPVIVEQLSKAIVRLRDETQMTIFLVEHHLERAFSFSPRCIVMERGRIVYDGQSAQLASDEQQLTALLGLGKR